MDSLNEIEMKILQYIKACMKRGQQHFKSKDIAKEIGTSSYAVGINLGKMCNKNLGNIKIVNYARSIAVTWKVERCKS
jgi:hypothetical protein